MLLSPFRNCNEFVATRPAMVIFSICLIFMTTATFTLTFYLKRSDKIINTDHRQNWITLSDYLSNVDVCARNSAHTEQKRQNANEEATFTTLIAINSTQFRNVSTATVFYSLEGWRPSCSGSNQNSANATVKVTFNVAQNLSGEHRICARIEGPKEYLPEYSEPVCTATLQDTSNRTFYSPSKDTKSCSNIQRRNSSTRIVFDPDVNVDKFAIFLNQNDKNVIYIHLMWFGYILLFFVLVVLLYAMLYQSQEREKSYM